MQLENIRYVNFDEPDRRRVQEHAIESAQAEPEKHLQAYRQDARSFDGRYVAADLFKETFPEFSASRESRNRYNIPVHNAAAVLSSALFAENLAGKRDPGHDVVYFLTGSPGAGKTSMMLKENALPADAHMVFEGQMSTFATSVDKIQQAIDAGFIPHVIVVHARSENALDNTLQRFYEEGRGSSIATIARIQGGLPLSLEQLGAYFGNNLLLDVIDVRDRANPVNLQGFDNLNVLKSEGTREHIQQRLEARVEQYRETGRINEDAYRQAVGIAPRDRLRVDQGRDERHQGDARERGSTPGRREEAVLATIRTAQPGQTQHAQTQLRVTDASPVRADVSGKIIEVTDTHVLVQTGRTDAVRFTRAQLSGEVHVGRRVTLEYRANERQQKPEQDRQRKPGQQIDHGPAHDDSHQHMHKLSKDGL